MMLRIKATGFSLTPLLEGLVKDKILLPLEKRLGKNLPDDLPLDVELAKTTKHHEEGKIWKCEVNLNIPREKNNIFVECLAENMEAAINGAKDELERKAGEYKDKKAAKFLRFARRLKENFHVTRLAKRAGGFFYREKRK